MVFGGFVAQIPNEVFIVVHAVALFIGIFFSVKKKKTQLFALFVLYSFAELSYLLYHLLVFNMLFSHILAEVFMLIAILIMCKRK